MQRRIAPNMERFGRCHSAANLLCCACWRRRWHHHYSLLHCECRRLMKYLHRPVSAFRAKLGREKLNNISRWVALHCSKLVTNVFKFTIELEHSSDAFFHSLQWFGESSEACTSEMIFNELSWFCCSYKVADYKHQIDSRCEVEFHAND